MRYKEYKTGDVLNFDSSNGIFHACNVTINDEKTDTNHPYVVRTSQNNGIRGYISEDESKLNPENTISFAQDTAQMFYQKEAYFTGNKVKVLSAKGHVLTKEIALFLISCLNKAFSNFVWGSSYDTNILKNTTIKLPVKTVYKPDLILISEILAGGGTDMSSIDTSSWKEFKVSEVFGKAKLGKYHNPTDLIEDKNGYPYICASNQNNGINSQMPRVNGLNLALTPAKIIAWGKQFPMFTYHDERCVTSQGMYYLDLTDYSENVALFICSALSKACKGKYSYSNCLIGSVMDEITIKLPVKESEEINWEYMQERISELEQERISELEQYLIATGLNDYELTDEDKEILATKLTDGGASQSSTSTNGCLKEARMFRVGDLFELQKVTHKLSKEDLSEEYDYPTYSSDTSNNGIIGYSNNPEFLCDEITPAYLIFGDHTRTFNIARKSFSVIDNVKVFIPCSNSDDVLLYITTKWKKQIPNLGYARHWKIAKNCELFLPIQIDSQNNPIIDSTHMYHPHGYIPDWEYMEKYIKATEKVVIRDVVEWKNEIIEKTKEVVECSDATQEAQPTNAQ